MYWVAVGTCVPPIVLEVPLRLLRVVVLFVLEPDIVLDNVLEDPLEDKLADVSESIQVEVELDFELVNELDNPLLDELVGVRELEERLAEVIDIRLLDKAIEEEFDAVTLLLVDILEVEQVVLSEAVEVMEEDAQTPPGTFKV